MEDLFSEVGRESMPLKALLKHFSIRYWQVVQRCGSKGIRTRETTLSRILSGLEKPDEELGVELSIIEQSLMERRKISLSDGRGEGSA